VATNSGTHAKIETGHEGILEKHGQTPHLTEATRDEDNDGEVVKSDIDADGRASVAVQVWLARASGRGGSLIGAKWGGEGALG
jgi:hypothetical protein